MGGRKVEERCLEVAVPIAYSPVALRINFHTLRPLRLPRRFGSFGGSLQQRSHLRPIIKLEALHLPLRILHQPRNAHAHILHRQLLILAQTLLQRPQPMLDQLLPPRLRKRIQMPLQIRPRHLTPRPDRTSHHLLRDTARLELEEVRAGLVHAGDQQPDTVRPFGVDLRRRLSAVAYLLDDALERDGAAIGQFGGESLAFHEVREDAGVGGETGEGEAEVLIDTYYLLLVGGELFCVSLPWRERESSILSVACVSQKEGRGGRK